ncbi:unnamed protein product [Agarophyton chilense]|eukprot:gb/GEZJ01003611.1/.p1 GENE.gb/GEZJ01003611.1/~~gb/GEZJ01003611.1/.p1  ORF type:complete len:252 (-),score=25.63 gb/GEZJ01003611.1/:432-1187(-)
MAKAMHLTVVLCFLSFVVLVRKSQAQPDKCFIELSRILGRGALNRFSLVCKSSERVAKSFAFGATIPLDLDTVARSNATIKCVQNTQHDLTLWCNTLNSTQFERRARHVLDRCQTHFGDIDESEQGIQPFTFVRDSCTSKFAWADSGRVTNVAWVCECQQFGFYEVVPGWADIRITGSQMESANEFEAIRICAEDAVEQMEQVCTNNPGDYYILALHIMQTCCKRFRSNTDLKFECAAIVPGDLSLLKLFL